MILNPTQSTEMTIIRAITQIGANLLVIISAAFDDNDLSIPSSLLSEVEF